jgi:hypothetical protein
LRISAPNPADAEVFARAAETASGARPYDFAVVDEAQDLGVSEASFLAALDGGRPNALFFADDLGSASFRLLIAGSYHALGV